jgi:RelB Antitoxin alpha helical domain
MPMTSIEQMTIDKMRDLPSELQQQVLTFAEFLEFKQQQLEDEGLLRVMQETKDDETINLVNAKLYLDSLPETLREQ